jgi:hypothetical protein
MDAEAIPTEENVQRNIRDTYNVFLRNIDFIDFIDFIDSSLG